MPSSYDLSGKGRQQNGLPKNPLYKSDSVDESATPYSNTVSYGSSGMDNKAFEANVKDLNGINVDFTEPEVVVKGQAQSSSSSSSQDGDDEKHKKKAKPDMVGVGEVFKFATTWEKFLVFLGVLFSALHGATRPLTAILFGNMADAFIDDGALEDWINEYSTYWYEYCMNLTQTEVPCQNITSDYLLEDPYRLVPMCFGLRFPPGCEIVNATDPDAQQQTLLEQISDNSIIFAIIACAVLVFGYISVLCWQTAAYNQAQRIRVRLFEAILRQEIGWFDTHEVGELNTRMSDDVTKFENGVGDKLGLFFSETSIFVVGIIVGFVYSWKLTLVILSLSPLLILSGMAMGRVGSVLTSRELKAYAKAGAVAEEVLGAVRTVMAFGGEQKECARYNTNLETARDWGMKKGVINGLVTMCIMIIMFSSYALGFWYGSTLVFGDEISAGDLLTVFFCVMMGTFSIGNAAPHIQDFAAARGAAHALFGIISQVPKIDSSSPEGKTNPDMTGNVQFQDVHFNFPSRPDVKVLKGITFDIKVGQTVALVGASGCGKSTTVQLLQRFYDPISGVVTIGGSDVREYNLKWLRQQIGVVSQEPVLFAATIAENVRYGQEGVSADDIISACKKANAHDFITKLPKKYDTLVGERGAQLSGGQKQRIAIARALVRNPKILLLDEATSALDTESEATVQEALDTARMGRTTLVVAHRLSTIRTADVIIGVKDGRVHEKGSHTELMDKQGLYYELVKSQQAHFDEDKDEDEIAAEIIRKDSFLRDPELRGSGKQQLVKRALSRGISTVSGQGELQRTLSDSAEEEKVDKPPLKRIMRLNAPEWHYIVIGCFSAIVAGCMQPAFALIFSEILGLFSQGPEAQDRVSMFSGLFVILGVVSGLGMLGTSAMFARSGEYLTMRLRMLYFEKILQMEMAYFDDHKNSVGALCTRLATDASAVQGATGSRLGMFCQSLAAIISGLIIGFIYSWELTLLILAFGPFLLLSGFVSMRTVSGKGIGKDKAMEDAGKIAIQAIENIRTVATLTKEQAFLADYERETLPPLRSNKRKIHIEAGAYGFSQAVMFWAQAAAFTLGAYLVEEGRLEYENMYRVFMAVVMGAIASGRASSFAPDYGKAVSAAGKMFAMFERETPINSADPKGRRPSSCEGSVKMRNVHFNYPTRPGVPVLRGLDLDVRPGERVALVGASGCGKSTTVQLLQRFYDPHTGHVCVEDENLTELNIQWLRSKIGIVSQEPVLFDSSIRENIAYGDNSRQVSMGEIIEAAKNANIHNFIEGLPQGYDTNVGDKGAQLSGGQKQRVAIARALVRNPKILLLDEATSALDTESEKIVQAALDRAQEGRTSLVIAHRLSTIQNADKIIVFNHGRIAESGTHSELIQKRGIYFKLNNAQLKKD